MARFCASIVFLNCTFVIIKPTTAARAASELTIKTAISISHHLPYGIGAVGSEDLLKVSTHAVCCHRAVTHYKVIWLLLSNSRDNFFCHIFIKASNQIVAFYIEHFLAGNGGFLKRKMPRHSEERKQHMREVMIEKWRERHGKSNDYSSNDQSVHSCTN